MSKFDPENDRAVENFEWDVVLAEVMAAPAVCSKDMAKFYRTRADELDQPDFVDRYRGMVVWILAAVIVLEWIL